ncbi:hypothetical protein [Gilliamella sp. W8128]|uniref:hypothetical protein n=1 Tax=Gilliamella sp. W8128 TaxID=2751010 RepID=UPI0018DEA8BC|nr:hypothetical protein [Gilliamella sp. W8128]MBI0153772.1 hypothetical protein [Gilliamella sp. W8128]
MNMICTDMNKRKTDIITKIVKACISLVPDIGNITNSFGDIYAGVRELYYIKQENKMYQLFNQWLTEIHILTEKQIHEIIENENFSLIIKKVLEDDDDKKIIFYSRLLKKIPKLKYTENNKKSLIFILYNITMNDIELAEKFYNYSKEKCLLDDAKDQIYRELSFTDDGFILASLNNLKNYGLFKTKQTYGAGDIFYPTILFNQFCEIIFDT